MGNALINFLIVITILAVLTRETFVVTLLYLVVAGLLAGRWWTSQVVGHLAFQRKFTQNAFPGETVPVQVDIQNKSWLPAVWLRVQDYYPLEVADTRSFQQVITLGPHEKLQVNYQLRAQKRGYYEVGPLHVTGGDLLGLSGERSSEGGYDHLTVYPHVVALKEVKLPSYSPFGTLRTREPIFEDPSRPIGTRDYQTGDSMRHIDWKSTASTGRLQTRLFQPSIALDTVLFLNLNLLDYHLRSRFDATELAITITASLASWITAQRQSVGMVSNALDPLAASSRVVPLRSGKGHVHLIRILEVLARAKAVETTSFAGLIRQHRVRLSWGTTLVAVTGSAQKDLMDELLMARRSGLNPVLILVGNHPVHQQAKQTAQRFHIPVFSFLSEKDLDVWRK